MRAEPLTDSNQRIYYKIPQQLERHHKKTLQWTTTQAALMDGANAEALKPWMDMSSGPLRTRASVLPAVELDESVFFKGIDTSSFNPMALQVHNGHNESQSDAIFKEINPWHDPEDPDTEMTLVTERAGGQSSNTASTQNFAQSILTFSTVNTAAIGLPSTSALGVYQPSQPLPAGKPKKRCVVCVYFNCRRRNSCAGSGGRELCGRGPCGHNMSEVPSQRIYKPAPQYKDREIN
ncbi:hypothetical protein K438DRAFT_965215 [Mycena galopus ATCC 62051]|nr:hypothetical protein K438DRAFT_965215 [Mycena galopus ATCC 62051]